MIVDLVLLLLLVAYTVIKRLHCFIAHQPTLSAKHKLVGGCCMLCVLCVVCKRENFE